MKKIRTSLPVMLVCLLACSSWATKTRHVTGKHGTSKASRTQKTSTAAHRAHKRSQIHMKWEAQKNAVVPSQADKLITEGVEALDGRQYLKAIQALEKATRLNPNSAEAFYQLGNAYYRWGFHAGTAGAVNQDDAQQAITAYRTAESLDRGHKEISNPYLLHNGLGMCYQGLGQYDDAISELKNAARISPNNPMPALYASMVRFQMKDTADAVANFDLSLRVAQRAGIYPMFSRLVRGNPAFSQLVQLPESQKLLDQHDKKEQQRVILAKGQERAQEALRDALRSQSMISDMRHDLKDMLAEKAAVDGFVQKGDLEYKYRHFHEAAEDYLAALQQDKDKGSLDASRKSDLYQRIGASYRQLGLLSRAISVLQKSVAEAPNADAYYQMALTYSSSGRFPQALTYLQLALKHAGSPQRLRRLLILARTDTELDPLRGAPAFRKMVGGARVQSMTPRPKKKIVV